jgi:hypothetical protein
MDNENEFDSCRMSDAFADFQDEIHPFVIRQLHTLIGNPLAFEKYVHVDKVKPRQ